MTGEKKKVCTSDQSCADQEQYLYFSHSFYQKTMEDSSIQEEQEERENRRRHKTLKRLAALKEAAEREDKEDE